MGYSTGKIKLRRTLFITVKKRRKTAGFFKVAGYFIGIKAVVYPLFRFIIVIHGNLIAQPFDRCSTVFNADNSRLIVLDLRIDLCA